MPEEAPFDAWDGEELGLNDEVEEDGAEEVALHVDPESEIDAEGGHHWSYMTEGDEAPDTDVPVRYFADEQPDDGAVVGRPNGSGRPADEREPDLEELLERQHYAFPE